MDLGGLVSVVLAAGIIDAIQDLVAADCRRLD